MIVVVAVVISALGWAALAILAAYAFGGLLRWAIGERCGGRDAR